jgi:hypothetical protein
MHEEKGSISINFEVRSIIDGWIFGSTFLLINGTCVGNKSDYSVDMKGCLRWWLDLANNPRNRFEPGLYESNKEKVFLLLASSVLVGEDSEDAVAEGYADTFARFHISHIGMSSFDDVTMIFVKNEAGLERLIWKTSDDEVHEAHFDKNELERAFLDASTALEKAIS